MQNEVSTSLLSQQEQGFSPREARYARKHHPDLHQASENSDVLAALKLLTDLHAGCVELRAIMRDGCIRRGFYDDLVKLSEDAAILDAKETAKGIYFTANPVSRELLLRSRNALTTGIATADADIITRRWLMFDCDPVRPKNTSASDVQHDQALARAAEMSLFTHGLGWSAPIISDSGNGAHVLYHINLPNDAASLALIKGVLGVVAEHFSDGFVNVDLAVCNASRLLKLYGTHARKGEATVELPHRLAKLLVVPPELKATTAEQLRALLPPAPESVKHQHDASGATEWDELKAQLRDVLRAYKTKEARGFMYAPGRCHGSTDGQSIHMRLDNNSVGCFKGCSIGNILTTYGLPAYPFTAAAVRVANAKRGEQTGTPGGTQGNTDTTSSSNDDEDLSCSDMSNGYRFAHDHRDVARFNKPSDKWFCWDGKRWTEDNSAAVMRLAKQTVKGIYGEAAYTTDEERRKALAKHALKSEADARIMAMLHQAQSELPVSIDSFDSKPLAFNCANGIIDLRTGVLHQHARDEMHTKFSPVTYDPEATAPKWEAFLNRIFAADESLIRFVQKAVGYSLTGDVSEQCLFICHGTGANGKSVLLKTLSALVANYGQQVRTETLMLKRHVGVSNDIAALRGARFISAVETDDGQRLAESTVKQLTGGDAVRARFLFQESFEFQPQFKIWLAANHKPEIRGTDHAIWRRIRLVPFNVTIPEYERNQKLDSELREELTGILAWAVRGCLGWQQEGLGTSEAVTQATSDYKDEMDSLAEFLAGRCAIGDTCRVSPTEIYVSYESWCQSNGELKQPQKWLVRQLKDRGFQQEKAGKGKRFWKGLGLLRREES